MFDFIDIIIKGGPLMAPLLLCSVIALTVVQDVAHQIGEILEPRLTKTPDLLVLINADEQVEHALVVEIMDQARQAGGAKMAIAVKPKESRSEK